MQPFNVEIFDRDFNFIHNYTIESIEYHEDYLALPETVVFMSFNENVKKGHYITVYNDEERFTGVISRVTASAKYNGFMEVGFKDFISLLTITFAAQVTNISSFAQTESLEYWIRYNIVRYFVMGQIGPYLDPDLAIPGLDADNITLLTSTKNWNIGLVNDMEDDYSDEKKMNLIDDIIIPAMKYYKIGCYTRIDFQNKSISIDIGIKNNNPLTIETSLPNIFNVNYTTKDMTNDVNTVICHCTDDGSLGNDYDEIYYKHTDGSWSKSRTGRLLPVILEMMYYTQDQDIIQMLVAEFGGSPTDNCVEITVANSDPLATMFKLGDAVNIIINDTIYTSIYTGKDKTNVTKLIFGTIRLDLTKILKRRI